MHVAEALVYLIVTALAVVVAVTDSRGGARVARAGVVAAVLAAPALIVSDMWIPLGFPDHTGTTVFFLVPFLLIDRVPDKWFTAPLVAILLCAGQISDVTVRYVAVPAIVVVCGYRVVVSGKFRSGDAANVVAAVVSVPAVAGGPRDHEAFWRVRDGPTEDQGRADRPLAAQRVR